MSNIESIVMKAVQESLTEKSSDKKLSNKKVALVDELGFSSMEIAVLIARLDMETNKEPFAEKYAITDMRTIADIIEAYESDV